MRQTCILWWRLMCSAVAEIFRRVRNGLIGIVTTAAVSDATPAAVVTHTRDRDQSAPIVESFLHGTANYSWTKMNGVDVLRALNPSRN